MHVKYSSKHDPHGCQHSVIITLTLMVKKGVFLQVIDLHTVHIITNMEKIPGI